MRLAAVARMPHPVPLRAGIDSTARERNRFMVETTIGIDGMMCEMCEAHVNDAIRNHFQVKKVKADRKKKRAVVVSEESMDAEAVKKVIAETGYDFIDMTEAPYEKKGLFG